MSVENEPPTSPIDMRPGTSSDLPRLADVMQAAVFSLNAADYSPSELEAIALGNQPDTLPIPHQLLVAEFNSRVVGYAAWQANTIVSVFVHPDVSRRGIGSQLLAEIEHQASVTNVPRLVVTASLTGVPFYQACGFRIIGTDRTVYDPRHPIPIHVVTMAKDLTGPSRSPPQSKRSTSRWTTLLSWLGYRP